MSSRHIRAFCELSADCERLLERAMTQQGLSARAHDRILKVARTIADIEENAAIEPQHIAEAIQYRVARPDLLDLNPQYLFVGFKWRRRFGGLRLSRKDGLPIQ